MALGEPVFDKLHAQIAKAVLSINVVKGFEYGSGFGGCSLLGSQHNDVFNSDGTTKTNFSGGIQEELVMAWIFTLMLVLSQLQQL